jgi:hypothetical protein
MNSVAPDTEPTIPALTPQQNMRRKQLQGMVAGVVSALVSFTALAATVYAVKRHHEAAIVLADAAAKPAPLAAAPTSAPQPAPTAASPSGSEPAALAAMPVVRARTRPHATVAHPKPAQTRVARPSTRKPLSR